MKQTFRVPVRELLEPFYTDRADPQDLARFTRWGAFGKMLQVAGLWLIVVFTAFELITGVDLKTHFLLLLLALGVSLAGFLLGLVGSNRILGVMEKRCDPRLYAGLMYESALRLQKARMPKQSVREGGCGRLAANFATALGYMGRWEEARELVSRLLRCEPTPVEELICHGVMVCYYSHHMETEALREALQDMRYAANGVAGGRTGLLIQHAERTERISRAFQEEGLEGAYRACREIKQVKDTPLTRVRQAFDLGRMELALGRTGEAKKHLAYAAKHGKDLQMGREAEMLLKKLQAGRAAGEKSGVPDKDHTDRERGTDS